MIQTLPFNASVPIGVYNVLVQLSGPSASEFSVVYSPSQQIRVLDTSASRPGPVLLSALYSKFLDSVTLTFDAATDQGGMQDQFDCSRLFVFKNATRATCSWQSTSVVSIYQSPSNPILNYQGLDAYNRFALTNGNGLSVGDVISVRPSKLKSFCDVSNCTSWGFANTSIRVSPPAEVLLPNVSVAIPTILGVCSDLMIDLTSSTGAGIANWVNVSIEVFSRGVSTASIQGLRQFIAQSYTISPPRSLPRSLFDSDR
eukprot:gene41895-51141_t